MNTIVTGNAMPHLHCSPIERGAMQVGLLCWL